MTNAIKYPETVKFYKKNAEVQFKIAKPEADERGGIGKKGAVFLEIAKAIPGDENGRIDWQNKIVMKIGTNDIAEIVYGLKTRSPEIKLFHKNSVGNTACNIKPGQNGSFQLSVFKNAGDVKSNASLYLSGPDMVVLSNLLQASLPVTLGWS